MRRVMVSLTVVCSVFISSSIAWSEPNIDVNLVKSKANSTEVEAAKARVATSAKMSRLPANVQPSLQSLSGQWGYRQIGYVMGLTCSPYSKSSLVLDPQPCWLGDPKGTRTLVLYGDSHAGSWIPAMDQFAKSIRARLAVYWFPGCPTPLVVASTAGTFYSSRAADCNAWNARVTTAMASVNPFAIVMASGYGVDHSFTAPEYQKWINGWSVLAGQIRMKSPRVALYDLATTPYLRQSGPLCLAAQPNNIGNCGFSSPSSTGTGFGLNLGDNRLRDIAASRAAGATFIDVIPLFCTSNFCPAVIGGTVVYGDDHHITTAINLDLAPALGELLASAGLK